MGNAVTMYTAHPATLLARVANSLERDVVPFLAPSYQRTEVEATVALLRHLAGRVEWRDADLEEDLALVRESLAAIAPGAAPAGESDGPVDFEMLAGERTRLGRAIDDVYAGSDPNGAVAALMPVLRAYVDAELDRNTRGSVS